MNVLSKWHARMFPVTAWALLWALSACRPSYEVVRVEGIRAAIDSTWDARPDAEAVALLVPYKQQVDSVMQQVLGTAALTMEPYRPESPSVTPWLHMKRATWRKGQSTKDNSVSWFVAFMMFFWIRAAVRFPSSQKYANLHGFNDKLVQFKANIRPAGPNRGDRQPPCPE